MKKAIICLGLALLAFTNEAVASNNNSTIPSETVFVSGAVTPLCTAISKGELDMVKKFVEYGADVNETSNGVTPLMLAARYNNVAIIEFLIEKGARLNTKSENGYTALKYAEMSNAQDAVAFLKKASKK